MARADRRWNRARRRNLPAMEGALKRWVAEADTRPDGAERLRARVAWIDGQIASLSDSVARETLVPMHLDGLTVWDLNKMAKELLWAAARLDQRQEAGS